jgi:hypothetical protein
MKGFAVVIVVLAVLAVSVAASPACTNSLQIVDDDALSARIELARKVYYHSVIPNVHFVIHMTERLNAGFWPPAPSLLRDSMQQS